jgi:hypothetical protein
MTLFCSLSGVPLMGDGDGDRDDNRDRDRDRDDVAIAPTLSLITRF